MSTAPRDLLRVAKVMPFSQVLVSVSSNRNISYLGVVSDETFRRVRRFLLKCGRIHIGENSSYCTKNRSKRIKTIFGLVKTDSKMDRLLVLQVFLGDRSILRVA